MKTKYNLFDKIIIGIFYAVMVVLSILAIVYCIQQVYYNPEDIFLISFYALMMIILIAKIDINGMINFIFNTDKEENE